MAAVGVGLIGLGTVGGAVARRLLADWELLGDRAGATPVLRRVAVRNPAARRDIDLRTARLDGDPEALVDDPAVTMVVELMGGVDRAASLLERALRAAKPVVTANKAVMAAHGLELAALAQAHGVSLRYEAAVGGAMPAVALLRDSLRGDRVTSLETIINGTTTYILARMEADGLTAAAALADAQRLGFAEADPAADIDGYDAAAKVVILGRLAFDVPLRIDDVAVQGVRGVDVIDVALARALGASIRLVALARRTAAGVTASVHPTVMPVGHPLGGTSGVENALVVTADLAGRVVLRGAGAGGDATASAVVSDIVQTVRRPGEPPPVAQQPHAVDDGHDLERALYVRLRLEPSPEGDRLVVQALADRGVAVRTSTVQPGAGDRPDELAVITDAVTPAVRDNALDTLEAVTAVRSVETVLDCAEPR